MATENDPDRPRRSRRRPGPAQHMAGACRRLEPPLSALPGGLFTDRGATAPLYVAPEPGVPAASPAQHSPCRIRCIDALASMADAAVITGAKHYDALIAAVRASDQRQIAALAGLREALASDRPLDRRELQDLVTAAEQERNHDSVALRARVRTLGHHYTATCKTLAAELAAFIDLLDALAEACRRATSPDTGPHGDQEPS